MNKIFISIIVATIFCYTKAMGQEKIIRKDLLTISLKRQKVAKVETKTISMPAGGKADRHLHPCPVFGYVVSGAVFFQIEGQDSEIIKEGFVFYEPKDIPILHFDNASQTEPLTFIAFYLLEGNEELIKIDNNQSL